MGDDNDKTYTIDTVFGGDIGKDLIGCYFKLKPGGKYNFHDKDKNVKAHDLEIGSQFSFRLDENPAIDWHLTLAGEEGQMLTGGWQNGPDPALADGEYQAQAGGSGEEEPTNAASAGGYPS